MWMVLCLGEGGVKLSRFPSATVALSVSVPLSYGLLSASSCALPLSYVFGAYRSSATAARSFSTSQRCVTRVKRRHIFFDADGAHVRGDEKREKQTRF